MSEGYEYNLLTQELLLQGYTAEHYPDYVRIGNGRLGKSPLENSCGGFIYTKDYLEKKAFMSGCGLYVSWEKCINDIDYLEETFCFENDNVRNLRNSIKTVFVRCICLITTRSRNGACNIIR